jgi:pimeloyl-ACP methyl ester carboxylesterase
MAPGVLPAEDAGDGRIVRLRAQDGLNLAVRVFDAPRAGRAALLCLPGLSRNSRDFLKLGRYFSGHAQEPRAVIAVDYRGRGLSERDPKWQNYTPIVEAQDVFTAAVVLGIEKAVIVGTSRGGILAMLLGALRPGLVAGVVLNDIGPVVEGTGLARIKKYLSAQRTFGDREQAIAALRGIAEPQFPALDEDDWASFADAIFVRSPRGLVPDFDPSLVRTMQDIDFADRIPALWPQFASLARVPVLAIRGELSDILSVRTLAEMAARHPQLEQASVKGQGHAPLLRDAATLERILAFARRCETQNAA